MIAVDTQAGVLLRDAEIKKQVSPTQSLTVTGSKANLLRLQEVAGRTIPEPANDLDILGLTQRQVAFGYTTEELEMVFKPMVKDGQEALGSMGDDTPLAVLSLQPRLLYTYFCQLFAQVTNPPIDPIRERLVMSLATPMGWRRNLFGETPEHAKLVFSESPILFPHELEALKHLADPEHKCRHYSSLLARKRGSGRTRGSGEPNFDRS